MLPPVSTTSNSKGKSPATHSDDAIRSTDDDAAVSRLSAVTLGYLSDPYISILYKPKFAPSGGTGGVAGPSRKPPLINVGTHHRSYGIDLLVDQFLEGGGKQIVSLGAGSDTRFWRIRSRDPPPSPVHYVELDFPHLTAQKAQRIMRSPKLHTLLSPTPSHAQSSGEVTKISQGGTSLSSTLYTLLPLDLRQMASLDALHGILDPALPTLILAECVFCYMTPGESEPIIKWFEGFRDAGMVIYEMCGLQDQFGQVMKRNLASRNLTLPGAIYASPQAMAERLRSSALSHGAFERVGAKSLWDIREHVIPPEELSRIARLEHLDEIEELRLVLSHYCIAWGIRGSVNISL